jgi:glutamyl-tRNA(Gln) amidotransferase subunit E
MTSRFKAFEDMTLEDYAALGFMCGLEVHQQLLTDTKLFCHCPAGRYSNDYDAEILRHMRPTLSELGEYDGTALMEKKTRKNIFYRIHHDTVCTYEFDDTPPFLMNDRALDIALELCLLLRLNVVGELHIARKQYLDGSIPTGFQRTGIIGVTGTIPYRDRRIGIRQLSIEEDACREVSDVGHDRVFLTDRLGMPLVEIVTEPDMRTPTESAEVCEIIRRLCRSTGKVRTGYGAARQDVNVSIRGGTRVEIKGVPQIWRIPRLVYNEARRQWSLLQVRQELRQRGITPETLAWDTRDVTRILANAEYEPIRAAVAAGQRVKCVVLRGFAGILNTPTQEHTTLAREFSDRVRVIACLTRLPNVVHSDMATEALSAPNWQLLRRRTRSDQRDALVLVWGNEADTQTACQEIVIRAREAAAGVPSDTRQPLQDGTTGFERVLPGAERMYPDTDLPPLAIAVDRVERIREQVPPDVWDREAEYRRLGLPADTIAPLLVSARAGLFARLVDELQVNPTLAAVVICRHLKALRRAGRKPERLADQEIYDVFAAHARGELARPGIFVVLEHVLVRKWPDPAPPKRVATVLAELELQPLDAEQVRGRIAALLTSQDPKRFGTAAQRQRHVMGRLMRTCRGRVEGALAARLVAEELARESAARLSPGCEGAFS